MKLRFQVIALAIGLSLFSMACSKSVAVANMSEDDKHKLFQAVGMTQDPQLILEAAQKMGLADSSGQPTPAMDPFVKEHFNWATKNMAFVKELTSKEKAQEYVKTHMP